MSILKLTLENFKRYREATEVVFPKGLTLVTGENGAGKSTLTQAMLQALFGPYPLTDVRSDGTGNQTVRVGFALESQGVVLEASTQNTQHRIRVNGNTIIDFGPNSKEAATKYTRAFLGGLGSKAFERVYFAMQGETHALVTESRAELRRLFEEVLQLDVITTAVEVQAKNHQAHLNTLMQDLAVACSVADRVSQDPKRQVLLSRTSRAQAKHTRGEPLSLLLTALGNAQVVHHEVTILLQEQENAARQLLVSHQRLMEDQEQQILILENKVESWKQKERTLLELQRQQNSAEGMLKGAGQDLQRLEQELTDADSHQEAAQQHQQLLAQQEDLKWQWQSCREVKEAHELVEQAHLAHLKCQQKLQSFLNLEGHITSVQANIDRLLSAQQTVALDPHVENFELLQQEKVQLGLQFKEHQQALSVLTAQQDVMCPTCGQALHDHQRLLREDHLRFWLQQVYPQQSQEVIVQLQAIELDRANRHQKVTEMGLEVQQLREELAVLNSRIKERQVVIDEAEQAHQVWEGARAALGSEVFDPQQEIHLQEKLKVVEQQILDLQPQVMRFMKRQQLVVYIAEKKAQMASFQQNMAALKAAERELGHDPEKFQASVALVAQLKHERTDLVRKQQQKETTLKDTLRQVQDALGLQQQLEDTSFRVQQSLVLFQREEQLLEHLKGFHSHFFQANTHQVLKRATELLLPVLDSTLSRLEMDDQGNLKYQDPAGVSRKVQRLSGGEKALVGLCLRLALAERAQSIATEGRVRFLVLDEVLSSLDDGKREQVQDILEDVLRRGVFEHIIMITHIDDVKLNWRAHRLDVQKTGETTSRMWFQHL
ncbi:AAA family ATPase [Deinococcus cellulosilyticus]|uniref:YhaN AAA domain-containing protein n=1 Tax=Deinococcus cellulosilyticus (strain DSM 18568 / NBRC 106333 / KACC 11606 / 5516J-15) TaxID=1223518 RepID=A0A511NB66_DEIC1|nr:SMC family ATPase [Deinococcus cellulosilyticus]GEM50042.1 hypothetical protein DC3_56770 [Deinococcus cellulosilyticus NBRC 106333 = KACC 11606]